MARKTVSRTPRFELAFLPLWLVAVGLAQTGPVTTIAGGTAGFSGDGGPAVNAQLKEPRGLAIDKSGNLYVADTRNFRIRRISTDGIITTFAGNGQIDQSGDGGPATQASLFYPSSVAVDQSGNVYIGESVLFGSKIRKVAPDGTITTVAGKDAYTGIDGGDGGKATAALLSGTLSVAVAPAGTIYIAEDSQNRIRMVAPSGIISTLPVSNQIFNPRSLTLDAGGNLYVGMFAYSIFSGRNCTSDARVVKISPSNVITAVAGPGPDDCTTDSGDGVPATKANLDLPGGLALDSAGNLFIGSSGSVRMVDGNGIISTVANIGCDSVTVDNVGNLYCASALNHRIYKTSYYKVSPGGPQISAGAVVSAASYDPPPVAPGEMVVIFGSGLGPDALVEANLDAFGKVSTSLAGTMVLFDGVAAPMVYTTKGQISCIVPYEVANKSSTTMQVVYQGLTSSPLTIPVVPTKPDLFTSNSSGSGQAAAINQDGTINSASHPAAQGSVISLFGTGEGQTDPPGVDGKLATAPLPKPVLPVSLTFGGFESQVMYAGAAPGLVAGVFQVNAVVPSISSGTYGIGLSVGGGSNAIHPFGTDPRVVTVAVGSPPPQTPQTTVFLVHGIAQSGGDLSDLAGNLRKLLPANRFTVDADFDYGECANPPAPFFACPNTCSIRDGASKLATYIASRRPMGDVVVLGYSMGGLIARSMIVNGLSKIRVRTLVTLGTPNLGYPWTFKDEFVRCATLGREMYGDFRGAVPDGLQEIFRDDSGQEVTLSSELAALNRQWVIQRPADLPMTWLAVAGTSCPNPVRAIGLPSPSLPPGCSASKPFNDGVVCSQSAAFDWNVRNRPSRSVFTDAYAHTDSISSAFVFCPNLTGLPLFNPPVGGTVMQEILAAIGSQ